MYLLLSAKGFYKLVHTEFVNGKKIKHYFDITEQQAVVYKTAFNLTIYKAEK